MIWWPNLERKKTLVIVNLGSMVYEIFTIFLLLKIKYKTDLIYNLVKFLYKVKGDKNGHLNNLY